VLLVDHDEAQVAKRHQHRKARAEHHLRRAGLGGEPGAGALALAQVAVRGDQARAGEALAHVVLELRREPDLGHQHQRLAPAADRIGDQVQVDLGLAAAGHALQEDRVEALTPGEHGGDRIGLFRRGRHVGHEIRHAWRGLGGGRQAPPAHLPQPRRQACRDHLAQRPLVVGRTKFEQLELGRADRRHVVDHRFDLAQALRGDVARVRPAHHDPDLAAASKRHDHQRAEGDFEARRDDEIEAFRERNVECHAHVFHRHGGVPMRVHRLWISL
jgi:hypothetical protein